MKQKKRKKKRLMRSWIYFGIGIIILVGIVVLWRVIA